MWKWAIHYKFLFYRKCFNEWNLFIEKYEFNEHSSPFIELKQYDYEEVFSYFVDNGEESSIENAKLNFIVKYKDKYYTITKENLNGPNWSKNYRKDAYLDYKEYPSKSQYNHEAYVFSITDEFMESLTPDEEWMIEQNVQLLVWLLNKTFIVIKSSKVFSLLSRIFCHIYIIALSYFRVILAEK